MRKRVRRATVGVTGVLLLGLLLPGCRQAPRVYRVGILCGFDSFIRIADGFKAEMTALGHLEGKSIIYDLQVPDADSEGVKRTAREFVSAGVDLIFAFPTEAAIAAKTATLGTLIPVVFANANIEGSSLIESVRRPGGNITGICTQLAEQTIKRLELLHEMAPRARRIYIPHDAEYPGLADILKKLGAAAATAGLTLVDTPVNSLEELRDDLERRSAAPDPGVDAVLILSTLLPVSSDGFALINAFASAHRLPVGGTQPFMADAGAIFSFALEHDSVGRLAATMVDKILKGTPAGTIPVITAELILRINHRRLQELGLTASEGLLKMADEVIR